MITRTNLSWKGKEIDPKISREMKKIDMHHASIFFCFSRQPHLRKLEFGIGFFLFFPRKDDFDASTMLKPFDLALYGYKGDKFGKHVRIPTSKWS